METTTLVPQQEQSADENTPALRPWTTPRLMRLNGDQSDKPFHDSEVWSSVWFGPS